MGDVLVKKSAASDKTFGFVTVTVTVTGILVGEGENAVSLGVLVGAGGLVGAGVLVGEGGFVGVGVGKSKVICTSAGVCWSDDAALPEEVYRLTFSLYWPGPG